MRVAWSSRKATEHGYATVAAMIIALALALAASAVMASALSALREARADGERLRAAYGLEAAQTQALTTLLAQRKPGRYRWQVDSPVGPVEVLAEPEQPKLSVKAAADLDDATLARLGVSDPERLRARLVALAAGLGGEGSVAQADPAPLWQACAPSLISAFGTADVAPVLAAATTPGPGRFDWRAGEVWRLRLISARGWAEDRIVRLTGDERDPAAVIERRLFHDTPGGEPCASLFG